MFSICKLPCIGHRYIQPIPPSFCGRSVTCRISKPTSISYVHGQMEAFGDETYPLEILFCVIWKARPVQSRCLSTPSIPYSQRAKTTIWRLGVCAQSPKMSSPNASSASGTKLSVGDKNEEAWLSTWGPAQWLNHGERAIESLMIAANQSDSIRFASSLHG